MSEFSRMLDSMINLKPKDESIKDIINNIVKESDNEQNPTNLNDNTNLYIKGLCVNGIEDTLYKHFLKFGEIESIRILNPRGDNTAFKKIAFLNFLKPESARKALEKMHGKVIMGYPITIKWGKKIPSMGLNFVSSMAYELFPQIHVTIPEDPTLKEIIDRVSKIVAEEGYQVEKYIVQKEKDNSDFNFINFQMTPENNYYRWRVYSFSQGDTDRLWRQEPFQFNIGGNIWFPPKLPYTGEKEKEEEDAKKDYFKISDIIKQADEDILKIKVKRDSDNEDEDEDENIKNNSLKHIGLVKLSQKKKEKLISILQHLSSKRYSIKTATKFCFDNIQCSKHLVEIIQDSFVNAKTYQDKIVRLFLLSDLLYNSNNLNIFNSWCLKKEIENILPEVFEDLNMTFNVLKGKKIADQFNSQIMSFISLWKKWNSFEPSYLEGLEIGFVNKNVLMSSDSEENKNVKVQLENYEDELLDIYTQNEEDLIEMARKVGVSVKGQSSDIISKLVAVKEFHLTREKEKEGKLQQEKKYAEHVCELDKKIFQLKKVLNSLQNSYRSINEFDVDGLSIDPIEYKYLNIEETQTENKNEYDDIDGEPI